MIERLAIKLCNFILRHFTSLYYQDMLTGSILYGLKSAERDELENREAP